MQMSKILCKFLRSLAYHIGDFERATSEHDRVARRRHGQQKRERGGDCRRHHQRQRMSAGLLRQIGDNRQQNVGCDRVGADRRHDHRRYDRYELKIPKRKRVEAREFGAKKKREAGGFDAARERKAAAKQQHDAPRKFFL